MTDVLLIADTETCVELRHEIPVSIADVFAYAEVGGRRYAAIYSLETENVSRAAPDVEIKPFEHYRGDELAARGLDFHAIFEELCLRFARDVGLTQAVVPKAFPLGHADVLRDAGIELAVDQRFFDDRRRRKTPAQRDGIRTAQRAAEAGMEAVRALLARSEPASGGRLVDGEPLTCELLKQAAATAFAAGGTRGDDMQIAHGAQAASGHDPGSGRVANDDVVICDFFPREHETACFADMTRTFMVGTADPELESWHAQCLEALDLAVTMTRPGVNGADVHAAVDAFFAERGHLTHLTRPGGTVLRDGFNHATGHGVGLAVHEAPFLGRTGDDFVVGDVIALEPGLYRFGEKGVRVEDLVLVTEDGCEVLTDFTYALVP